MSLDTLRIFGNPNIGVYIFANNKVALIPRGLTPQAKRKVRDVLDVELIEAKIADSTLLGVFIAGNDRTILLPRIAKEEEVEGLRNIGLNVVVLDIPFTALGNIILTNNSAALMHPEIGSREAERIAEVLGVSKFDLGSIAKVPTVGSAAVVTDKGGVIHPDVTDEELKELSKFFGLELDIGTVNFGVAFIRTGLVANNHGALVGDRTTGPEIMRITKALGLGGSL